MHSLYLYLANHIYNNAVKYELLNGKSRVKPKEMSEEKFGKKEYKINERINSI